MALTRLSCVRTNILSEADEDIGIRKPGHPSQNDSSNESISGPKSFYQYSPYQKILDNVLAKPEARKTIYNYLLKSGLLYRHYMGVRMKAYYMHTKAL